MTRIAFTVAGIPAPKGSARAIKRGKGDKARAVLVASSSDANKRAQSSWSAAVGWAAKAAWSGRPPFDGPVGVSVTFRMPRPPSVTRALPDVKPDVDKLLRSTFDALSGIAFADDARVIAVEAVKLYAFNGQPGASIEVYRYPRTAGPVSARSDEQ